MKNYKHIFFDLDRTLWDFDENTKDTFNDIFNFYKLKHKGIPDVKIFHNTYNKHNDELCDQYRKWLVEKSFLIVQRYILTLNDFNICDDKLAENLSKDYLKISPLKTKLIPYAHEVLQYLSKKYLLHIITNGFNEVQYVKIENSDLKKYFDKIITSEEAGCNKPNKNIFSYSLNKAGASVEESIMIGDALDVDIIGAQSIGMDQVFYNPEKNNCSVSVTFKINSLKELFKIL